jgi:hypothetical protein
MGDYRSCSVQRLRNPETSAVIPKDRTSETNGLKREALGRQWNYPVHPGNAKQAMEPATLWFERRVRRVQTCDKRQTLEIWAKVSKGGDYPSFLY